ncbi:hypothetical protein FJY93_03395 [Candidatus Kaiserbacteria bacterium]|nr:hypothetical protein [Candidatus Kaiserbacteria bacterium]
MKTAIFLYELDQVSELETYLASVPDSEKSLYEVIALGVPVEYALARKGISFVSGAHLRSVAHMDHAERAAKIALDVMDDVSLGFFNYREIRLTDVFLPMFQGYLQVALYFVDVFVSIGEMTQYDRVVVFPSTIALPETSGTLASLEVHAAEDAARVVMQSYGIELVVPERKEVASSAQLLRDWFLTWLFSFKRSVFGWGMAALNIGISMRPRAQIRMVASDYWRNIGPLIRELPEGELFLFDRMEAFKAGLGAIWRHRIRFVHAENFLTRRARNAAVRRSEEFLVQWRSVRESNGAMRGATVRGVPVSALVDAAMSVVVSKGGLYAIEMIDGVNAMYDRIRPDVISVRASISGQIHFLIMCHVAKQRGIPSIELQHGIFHIGRGSATVRPAAEYIATYGREASNRLRLVGYTDDKLLNVGSPRFDVYPELRTRIVDREQNELTKVAFAVPAVLPFSWSDTYEILKFFEDVADITRSMPYIFPVFKFRPDTPDGQFYKEVLTKTFDTIPHRIAQTEPFPDVITASDVLVTIYSTTVLEGLISGRPVIYNGMLEMHAALGEEFAHYVEAGALTFVKTREELADVLKTLAANPSLRSDMVRNADMFMKENYAFDAHASARLADTIRLLLRKNPE